MPRTAAILTLGATLLAGCHSNIEGPRQLRKEPRPDDPRLSIEEQKSRGRGRYAIPEDDFRIGPDGYIDRPSPTGR